MSRNEQTDWQTYRNGNLREVWNLERLARHRAAKLGYRLHRSRRRKGYDNAGAFTLIHKASSTVLLGAGFTATLERILEFMEREQNGNTNLAGSSRPCLRIQRRRARATSARSCSVARRLFLECSRTSQTH